MAESAAPIPAAPGVTPLQAAQAEALAMRMLLMATIWKTGGRVTVSEDDLILVGRMGMLHSLPVAGGQLLSVSLENPVPSRSGIVMPGEH